ncbi:CvpA family protein [Segnochrobactraceae bacterium EtOH-i3]
MSITLLDGIVIAVMLVSALLAMVRGFVREVLSIASWIAAAVAAFVLQARLLPYTKQYITDDLVARGVTIAIIFLVTLMIVSYITMKISDFVIDSRVGALDRLLGFLFGAARGLLLMVVAMLFFNALVPRDVPAWIESARSRALLNDLGARIMAALPEDPKGAIAEKLAPAGVTLPSNLPNLAKPGAALPPATAPATGLAPAAAPAAQTPPPAYRPGERQGLDQLIQSSGQGQ